MPKLIKDAQSLDDNWLALDADGECVEAGRILSLPQWESLSDKAGSAVQLESDQAPAPLLKHLNDIALITINFPVFTDGRGFSYARELRERGYQGELRAVGGFIRDQLYYLKRSGFNAFLFTSDTEAEAALASLNDFSEHYQAAIDEPQPLFRRR
ncbi:MAG: DUF934 domain-containing protein [Halioglobus sp.]